MQASQQHRLQCGPVHINLGGGGSPERDARPQVGPSASPSQLRARPARQRSACFGFVEADDEEAVHSAAEQRYLKVGVTDTFLAASIVDNSTPSEVLSSKVPRGSPFLPTWHSHCLVSLAIPLGLICLMQCPSMNRKGLR